MAFKPNYNQQRADRNRAKAQKKQEKLKRLEEETAKRKAARRRRTGRFRRSSSAGLTATPRRALSWKRKTGKSAPCPAGRAAALSRSSARARPEPGLERPEFRNWLLVLPPPR